jgi:hypothetical protein
VTDHQRDASSTDGALEPDRAPEPDGAFYDRDVVDPQTRQFAIRVIGLGVVVALALLLGTVSLIWPDALGDAVREMQGAH